MNPRRRHKSASGQPRHKNCPGNCRRTIYYARSVENKLLVLLSTIGSQKAAAMKRTNEAINQILDYCATYPANGILYRSSNMVLCAHSDAGFHNDIKGRSRAGAHIFLSENDAMPRWNGPVITLYQIIKSVMSSTSEAELGAIFITAQEMATMRHTPEEMKWTHPKSPIQTENSATAGVVNNTILPRKIKTMDRRLHWLRCREAQGQFSYYWASGNLNWGYYSTKHHPPSITNKKECNLRELQTASKTSGTSKVPVRLYCSRFQVELTSTWNHNTPHTYGKARTETSPRIANVRQHGGHKITA